MPIVSTSLAALAVLAAAADGPSSMKTQTPLDYTIELEVMFAPAEEGNWFQPRPVAIPSPGDALPTAVMTIQRALGSDFFTGLAVSRSEDLGRTWSPPKEIPELAWRGAENGLNFGPIHAWTFDDGAELGSYNTQQKWVTHSDGLFLVYTRRGANNDHIVRHRAPLFIARVDPERLCVLRDTERIAVPE